MVTMIWVLLRLESPGVRGDAASDGLQQGVRAAARGRSQVRFPVEAFHGGGQGADRGIDGGGFGVQQHPVAGHPGRPRSRPQSPGLPAPVFVAVQATVGSSQGGGVPDRVGQFPVGQAAPVRPVGGGPAQHLHVLFEHLRVGDGLDVADESGDLGGRPHRQHPRVQGLADRRSARFPAGGGFGDPHDGRDSAGVRPGGGGALLVDDPVHRRQAGRLGGASGQYLAGDGDLEPVGQRPQLPHQRHRRSQARLVHRPRRFDSRLFQRPSAGRQPGHQAAGRIAAEHILAGRIAADRQFAAERGRWRLRLPATNVAQIAVPAAVHEPNLEPTTDSPTRRIRFVHNRNWIRGDVRMACSIK